MENQHFNRRDFLKFLLLLPFAAKEGAQVLSPNALLLPSAQSDKPNILIFLFDTLSARNISLYGYPRETMPNLSRFAERATVYHQHHSGGNWTPPGTASLLTGTYPWTHRSLSIYSSVLDGMAEKNLFALTTDDYHTLAYTQNFLVETLLHQFGEWIDDHVRMEEGGVYSFRPEGNAFYKDYNASFWAQNVVQGSWTFPASSPFLSVVYEAFFTIKYRMLNKNFREYYPYWVSRILPGVYVFLDEAINWLKGRLKETPLPTLSYYHFFAPHGPYTPTSDFVDLFADDWQPQSKPVHALSDGTAEEYMLEERRKYDQFIANVDQEFGTVIELLDEIGMMENSYIIFTSDHGESLERGIWQHVTPVLYEPLTHIPLLIHKPGQNNREDVYTPTSAVDLLPTICQITGQEVPDWVEGEALPGFRTDPADPQRPIFMVEAKENSKFGPLALATMAMIKWPYKLIYYLGYEELPDNFELYNLEEDPEEMADLYSPGGEPSEALKTELLAKLDEVNRTFEGGA